MDEVFVRRTYCCCLYCCSRCPLSLSNNLPYVRRGFFLGGVTNHFCYLVDKELKKIMSMLRVMHMFLCVEQNCIGDC